MQPQKDRNVAQLVAHYVRDVGVGRSSRLIPTEIALNCCVSVIWSSFRLECRDRYGSFLEFASFTKRSLKICHYSIQCKRKPHLIGGVFVCIERIITPSTVSSIPLASRIRFNYLWNIHLITVWNNQELYHR